VQFILPLILAASIFAADALDIRVLRVEFKYEEPNNSLTTGRGTFDSGKSKEYWQSHLEFAKNYFEKASNGKVSIGYEIYPKGQEPYKLGKHIIDYNRTSRREGEKLAEFDSSKAADYVNFVNDVLKLAKEDAEGPLSAPAFGKRVILIAHAGSSRLIDGGTMGTRGANTPGDFIDAYLDTSWANGDFHFWRGFEVSSSDTITSVVVTSETASQDGLNWGINGTITGQIGRELGLPYSYDVVKGFSRLGYFDGMDFAGANAGNGFFPSLPSAWMRIHKEWSDPKTITPKLNEKDTVEICAAGYDECAGFTQIVKIPISYNEYILLENRQRSPYGEITVKMDDKQTIKIPVDSLQSHFLDSATRKYSGVIEGINSIDAALPASGIAAWHVNEWYVKELLPYGAINAWNGDTFRDHQFGIALIEASGVLGLGKEFRSASGESAFYFGSGSDLIPHKRFNKQKQLDTAVFSINPLGYANTASTFGGYSGIKITAIVPEDDKAEKTFNMLMGDSVVNWRALKIKVAIEREGEFVKPIPIASLPSHISEPTDEDFEKSKWSDFLRIPFFSDSMYLGNNRLHIVDSNNVPWQNFPATLSNSEPFTYFHSKPIAIDIGNDSLTFLIPANNGLILAVNSQGKLLKNEFPIAAGTFEYETPDTLLLHISDDHKYLFAKHRGKTSVFHLPKAQPYSPKSSGQQPRDEIGEFFVFPNPIRGGKASARFRILNTATSATLDIFDITGKKVFSRNFPAVKLSNQEALDLSNLGSDVYSARLNVKFTSGSQKQKWVRIGVIR